MSQIKERFFLKESFSAYVETSILVIISIFIGWYFFPQDPLLLNSNFSFFIFVLTIITLFYGFAAAAIGLTLMALTIYFFYPSFYYETFSFYLLLAFILSEFHFFWYRKLKEAEETNNFLREKLEENAKNLFVLKTSHDQLEKHYILKPMSIRATLKEIKKLISENKELAIREFSKLLSRVCGIESGAFFLIKEKEFIKISNIGKKEIKIKPNDPLVESVLEDKTIKYLTVSNFLESNYKAVLPAFDNKNEIVGLFIIEDISFLNLNKDNMLTISLFISYFINSYQNILEFLDYKKRFPNIEEFFIKEIYKLTEIFKNFKKESSFVIFSFPKDLYSERFIKKIESSLRGIDILIDYCENSICKVVVLLPLTSEIGAEEFSNRINYFLNNDFNELKNQIKTEIFSITKDFEKNLKKIAQS